MTAGYTSAWAYPAGSIWAKAGYTNNLNLAPSEDTAVATGDTYTGAEFKLASGERKKAIFSITGRGELQKYIKDTQTTAFNWTASFIPQYRYWSYDEDLVSTLSYKLTRFFSGSGLGQASNTMSHQFRFSSTDQVSAANSVGFDVRYRLTGYQSSTRMDGLFSLSGEFSTSLNEQWSLAFGPAFEGNASDEGSSQYSGPGFAANLTWIPSDVFFVLLYSSVNRRTYASEKVTDSTFISLLSLNFSLSNALALTLDINWIKNLSPNSTRVYNVYNPLAGLEYHF